MVAEGDFIKARNKFLSYQKERPRPYPLKPVCISKETGENAIKEADKIMANLKFPVCDDYVKTHMANIENAYLYTQDKKYAKAWLEMLNYFYVNHRPPAQRPKMYICFRWEPNWSPLGVGHSVNHLCESENWIVQAGELELDKDRLFYVYKSILEQAQYLYLQNDVFLPANWQVTQCNALIKVGTYFPSFNKAQFLRDHAWNLMQEHMATEIFDDGTHCEVTVNYALAVDRDTREAV